MRELLQGPGHAGKVQAEQRDRVRGVLGGQEEHPCLQSLARPDAGSHSPAAQAVMNSQGFGVVLVWVFVFFFAPDLKHVVSGWS